MRINGGIINTAVKTIKGGIKRVDSPNVAAPLVKAPVRDVLIKDAPLLRAPLAKNQILNMKPSEFKTLLEKRTDIRQELSELIKTPSDLSLYDSINNIVLEKKLPFINKNKILYNFLCYSEPEAAAEVVPKLVSKGYDIEYISRLPIDSLNKDIIEKVIVQHKGLISSIADKKIQNKAEQIAKAVGSQNYESFLKQKLAELEAKRTEMMQEITGNILLFADKNNVKYLKEYFELFDCEVPRYIYYWKQDTTKIFKKWLQGLSPHEPLDRIHRRGHNYESIYKIFGDQPITNVSQRLLEYKNFDKFKNIDLSSFDTLTVAEKKEFIGCYIQALTPKQTMYDTYSKEIIENFDELSSKMKIYRGFDLTDSKTLTKSYQDTLKKMLDSIPESERKPIMQEIRYGDVRKEYRTMNTIPALVDDITKLPYREEVFNGKTYKILEIESENRLGISTHRIPNGDSIINIEALEVTNPQEILCVGQKDMIARGINGGKGNGYALFVKPRRSNDLWLQARSDIDSGNNATKNVFNVNREVLRGFCRYKGNHVWQSMHYIPELLKKELNLSQIEYTARMKKLKDCTTLDEIAAIDKEFEQAIRKVVHENEIYEGMVRPDIMGIKIPYTMPLSEVNENILSYAQRKNIPLVRINYPPKEPKQPVNVTFKINTGV